MQSGAGGAVPPRAMNALTRSATLTLLLVPLVACAHGPSWFGGVRGSGTLSTREAQVGSFEAVEAAAELDVVIEEGDVPRVEVTVDENLQELVEVTVHRGTLRIETKENIDPNPRSRVRVVAPRLREAVASGSGDVTVKQRRRVEETLRLEASGSGDVQFAGNSRALSLELSGSGDVDFKGDAEELTAGLTGSGDLSYRGTSRRLSLELTGSGDVELVGDEAERLQAEMTGSGNLDARRLPARDVEVDTSGSGDAQVTVAGGAAVLRSSGSGDIEWGGRTSSTRIRSSGSGAMTSRD